MRGRARVIDPTSFGRTVDETPDKTRRMLSDYFEAATMETLDADAVTGAGRVDVEKFTDGSVHVTLKGTGKPLLSVVARFQPVAGGTRVDVTSDAVELARAARRGIAPRDLHRVIRDEVSDALDDIDGHRVVSSGFVVSRLIADAADD